MKGIVAAGVLGALVVMISAPGLWGQEDCRGCKDHPVLSRYPGSYIVDYQEVEFDEYFLLIGPIRAGEDPSKAKAKRVEGKVTKIRYQCPKNRSNLEVFKNYEEALRRAGYSILYSGRGEEIRGVYGFLERLNRDPLGGWDDPDIRPWFYLSAAAPGERLFVSLFVIGGHDGPRVVLSVVEPKGMELGLVTAREIAAALEREGHIALYSIHFDFDSAELRPESEPVLKEIATFLRGNPGVTLYVVGHTDNVGSLEYNLDLSKRRAEAVVKALVSRYGIEEKRLRAFGLGPLAPVASNRTEEGRAKNRRVELVEP